MRAVTIFGGAITLVAAMAVDAAAQAALCTANVGSAPVQCDPPPHTRGTVHVQRDTFGVPHITASDFYTLNFQIGVEDARDRLLQLELFRRASKGTLAEVFGTSQVQTDKDTRTMLYSEEERQYFFTTLPCSTQLALQAYADGINAYTNRIYRGRMRNVPHEFFLVGQFVRLMAPGTLPGGTTYQILKLRGQNVFKPGPWVVTDSVAIAEMLVAQFGGGGGRQLRNLALRNYLTTFLTQNGDVTPAATAMQIFDDVRWIRDPNAPTTVPLTGAVNPLITENGTADIASPDRCELGQHSTTALTAPFGAPDTTQAVLLDQLPQQTVLNALAAIENVRTEIRQRAKDFAVPSLHGSNAWVVAPSRSSSHQALLWGGPQEGFDVPNIDNEVYGRTPDLAVGGMKIPGAPGVLIGITDRFAWTTTSGEIDNSTVYVETLDPSRAPADAQTADSQYYFLFNGTYQPMDRRVEVIHFAGENPSLDPRYGRAGRAPVAFNIFRVNDCDPQHFHGPVVSFDISDPEHPQAFTIKTAYWKNETATLEGFAEMNTAKSFHDFDDAVAKVVSLHNFMYADALGNIAYWSAGAKVTFPASFDDRFPSAGAGDAEWIPNGDGSMYTPFSRLLFSVNPTQGYLVNWNTKPADQPCILEGNSHDEHWGEIYRSDRIAFLLTHNEQVSLSDFVAMSKDIGTIDGSEDTVRPIAAYFVPYINQAFLDLLPTGSPLTDPAQHLLLINALGTLNQWNQYLANTAAIYPPDGSGHYNPAYSPALGQPGMSILFQWWYAFKKNLFGGGMSSNEPFVGTINFSDTSIDGNDYLGETTYNMALHLLQGAESGVPQEYRGDYFGGHRDEIIIESLNDAIALLAGTGALPQLSYGSCEGENIDTPGFGTNDVAQWPWQPPNDLDFDCLDELGGAQMFASGTLPTRFGTAPTQNRSTYMQLVAAGQPPLGFNVLAPGQSAFIRHGSPGVGKVGPHYGDQAALFRNFQYKPMMLP